MLLFAETSDGAVAILTVIGTMVGGAAVWMASYFAGRRKERRTELKEDERGIVSHQEKLITRLSQEIDVLRGRVDAQNTKTSRLIAHMSYLEGIMVALKIDFRPYVPEPDPLPVSGGTK